jgi:phenylalanyl-tRNA synthetase beta chain
MPIINMPIDLLLERINAGAKEPVAADDLPALVNQIGCEVEEITEMHQYLCVPADKIYDRTVAQGPPLVCSVSGIDFREHPDALKEIGTSQIIRLDMEAVRPDLFDPGGMGRVLRAYRGTEPGLVEYDLQPAKITVQVDPRLSDDTSYRPRIACAVLRDVHLTHDLIKILMNLQEDLHWALGRDRKLASIGVYDLDQLAGTQFHYDAVGPDELRFVPLGFDPGKPDTALTPAEILAQHKTGQAYARLLAGFERYPLLRDAEGTVLSMPPIINSESTRVTMQSTNLFCDVTGQSQRTVERALNILVTSLKEMLPTITVEAVELKFPHETLSTPNLTPTAMTIDVGEARDTVGVPLDGPHVAALLERMGHSVQQTDDATLQVGVPAWRNDVMHPVDLIEDIAVAYGYDNIQPRLVPTLTFSVPRAIEEQAAVARQVLVGLGFQQVLTLVLTSEAAALERWRLPSEDPRAVRIENPISTEQTMCRVSLMPGLLETLAINKQHDLPQHLFEVGDVCFFDPETETGAREERFAAAVMIGTHVGYADIRAAFDAFAHELRKRPTIEPGDHPGFIPGRVARLVFDGTPIGQMGEVHPEVLENYGLKHPVSLFEISLAKLMAVRV